MMKRLARITAAADGAVSLGLVDVEIGYCVDREIFPELRIGRFSPKSLRCVEPVQ
jgi:hypothetical protein